MDAVAIERRNRAHDPWPGTFTTISDGGKPKRFKIFPPTEVIDLTLPPGEVSRHDGALVIGCGDGKSLRLEEMLEANDFLIIRALRVICLMDWISQLDHVRCTPIVVPIFLFRINRKRPKVANVPEVE